MNIAIIGAGLIGRKRASSLPKNVNLSVICDMDKKKVETFAHDFNCESETDWKKVVNNKNIIAVEKILPWSVKELPPLL